MTKQEIYIVGYPRSGNTWLSQLIADALDSPMTGKFHAIPIGQEGLDRQGDYIVRQLHLRVVSDEDKGEAVPDAWTYSLVNRGKEKVIHIVRDPRDVAVSVWKYWQKPTLAEAVKGMAGIDGEKAPLGGITWQSYVSMWLDCSGIIQTSYEALQQDTKKELRRIFVEMGIEPVNDLAEVIERQSIDNKRKQLEQEQESERPYHRGIQQLNLRKGIVGDWRNHFEQPEMEIAHDAWWELMNQLGYERNSKWWQKQFKRRVSKNEFGSYSLAGGEPMPLTIAELEALKDMCQSLPESPIVVHVGAGIGCSTLAILEERPKAVIVSIDYQYNTVELDNLKLAGLPWQNVIRITGKSQDVGKAWPWYCDMVFIDGDHRRPFIDDDIRLFTKWLKQGRLAVFHDYIHPDDRGPRIKGRVYEAVEEWLEREPHFRRVVWVERMAGFVNRGRGAK